MKAHSLYNENFMRIIRLETCFYLQCTENNASVLKNNSLYHLAMCSVQKAESGPKYLNKGTDEQIQYFQNLRMMLHITSFKLKI